MSRYQVIDLFCGMGGFSEGISMAGHQVTLAVDNNDIAIKTHQLNHPDTVACKYELGQDLKATQSLIRKHLRPGPWHLHGSPPCQSLSQANRQKYDPAQGMKLVLWYLDLVLLMKPTSWSMEQVRSALGQLRQLVIDPKYSKYKKVLSSFLQQSDHTLIINLTDFGIPQTRQRLFLGQGWTLPSIRVPHQGVLGVLPQLAREGNQLKGYSGTRSVYQQGVHIKNRPLTKIEGLRPLTDATFTLCASGPLRLTDIEGNIIRALTPEEQMKLQGFTREYYWPSGTRLSQKYRMIGNSVSPMISFAIGLSLKNSPPKSRQAKPDQQPRKVQKQPEKARRIKYM